MNYSAIYRDADELLKNRLNTEGLCVQYQAITSLLFRPNVLRSMFCSSNIYLASSVNVHHMFIAFQETIMQIH